MSPRRLIFILVLLLWVVNGALWAWVQFTPPPPPPPKKLHILVYCEKKDLSKKIQSAAEGKFTVEVLVNQPWKHPVQEGFLVVNTIPSEDTRKALHAAMKTLLPVKIVGEDIRLGTTYKSKAEANKALLNAKNKGYEFKIKDNIVDKTTKVIVVKLGPLEEGSPSYTEAQDFLKKFNLKEGQTEEVPLEGEAGGSTPEPSATPK